jgi:MarR family transcriptional regulator, 2-MHQ and catechol-resistance regulon repressor
VTKRRSQQRLALATYVRLLRAANAARAYAGRHLGGIGLTLTQFAVLEALYHLGPMSLSDMAERILTTAGNLTMVLGNLEKQDLAYRQKSPQDRRVLIVVLTAKGKALIRKLFPGHAAGITEFMSALSPAQQERLSSLCRQLGKRDQPFL